MYHTVYDRSLQDDSFALVLSKRNRKCFMITCGLLWQVFTTKGLTRLKLTTPFCTMDHLVLCRVNSVSKLAPMLN